MDKRHAFGTGEPPKPDDKPVPPIVWKCKCGTTSFAHQGYCGRCGEHKK